MTDGFIDQLLFFTRLIFGTVAAVSILWTKREPVVCLGWLLAVTIFPILGSLAYLVGGLNPYDSYSRRLRQQNGGPAATSRPHSNGVQRSGDSFLPTERWLDGLARLPGTGAVLENVDIEMLVDSDKVYKEFERAIEQARSYIFVQFYQILPDRVGKRFFFLLRKKAAEGVKIYVMYDAMGSYRLRNDLLKVIRSAGINIANFLAMHPIKRRFQINWRNHRKIIVCDGAQAFVGGFNIGEIYLQHPEANRRQLWRDAHFVTRGASVRAIEDIFRRDWKFATGANIPDFTVPQTSIETKNNLVATIASGPSENMAMFHSTVLSILHNATQRVWMVSAYFVPDRQIIDAMKQAVIRGVDVRVVIPKRSNHPITDFCSSGFFAEYLEAGIAVYRFKAGMCHAKLLLADADLVLTGSSNLDYRSFFLNFELDLYVRDRALAQNTEKFILDAIDSSELLLPAVIQADPMWLRFARRVMRLFAPIM